MTAKGSALRLPRPNPGCLQAIAPAELAAAYVAAQKNGCTKREAASALSEYFPAEPVIAEAAKAGLILERLGFLEAPRESEDVKPKKPSKSPWADAQRAFALRALGFATGVKGTGARTELAAIALRQLYGLDNLSPAPSRGQVRCELLRRIVLSFGEPFAALVSQPVKAFAFDPMSRRIYLALAGLEAGTVLQADAALLSSAFGGAAATAADLAATIIRAALQAKDAKAAAGEEAFDLDGFAQSVRRLAQRLETKPYAGRVAIAQVYDAGLAQGLDLGTLDEFKSHLAEAAREGLLDLERYDITGPLDASLKERSRLRLGRDERHFIVNQWI